jgi:hypothetical protein
MDSRFSRVKSPTATTPQKGAQYKRNDIIAGLDPRQDYRGVSHYSTPDGATIYIFFVKGQHGNNWNRPVFTYGNLPPPPLRFCPKTKKTAAKPALCFTMTMMRSSGAVAGGFFMRTAPRSFGKRP